MGSRSATTPPARASFLPPSPRAKRRRDLVRVARCRQRHAIAVCEQEDDRARELVQIFDGAEQIDLLGRRDHRGALGFGHHFFLAVFFLGLAAWAFFLGLAAAAFFLGLAAGSDFAK